MDLIGSTGATGAAVYSYSNAPTNVLKMAWHLHVIGQSAARRDLVLDHRPTVGGGNAEDPARLQPRPPMLLSRARGGATGEGDPAAGHSRSASGHAAADRASTAGRPARVLQRTWAWLAVLLLVGVAVAGALIARSEGVRPVRIVSGSMVPAVEPGDWVVVRDVGPVEVRRGEIVLFRYPFGSDLRAIKRVVAVGGDVVPAIVYAGRAPVGTVPPGHVFVLGDNAAASIDSRDFGAVSEAEVVARVALVVPGWIGVWVPRIAAALAAVGLALVAVSRFR